MIYFLVLVLCLAFIAFFALLELRYFWIFPLFFLIVFFSQSFVDMRMTFQGTDLLKKYGLYAFSLLMFFGLLGMLEFFNFSYQSSFFILLTLCWVARYASYFFEYQDWKNLFFHGFLFILILLIGNSYSTSWFFWLKNMSIIVLITAILWFWGLYYWVWLFKEVKKDYEYYFFLSIFICILDILFLSIPNQLYALDINLLVYLCVLGILSYALATYRPKEPELRREISLRRVLAWEKILESRKKANQTPALQKFSEFVHNTPLLIKYLLEYINVILLIGIILAYLIPIFQWKTLPQMRYRWGIIIFLINAFLLKKYWIFTVFTRFAVVIIVNFSLYISLLTFGDAITDMVPWLIAWNILCGLVMFYTKLPWVRQYIKPSDIIFRHITSLVAMLLNIVLLLRLDAITWQIVFSLIFLYLGLRGRISYYIIQLVKDYPVLIEQEKEDPLDNLLEKEISIKS